MKKFLILTTFCLASSWASAQSLADFANAGDAAMAKQNYQEAVDNYIKAQELDKDNSDYLTAFQMGLCYQQLGDNVKAGEAFKNSILKGNTDPGVFANMKNAFDAEGCKECLKNAYLEVKQKNPSTTFQMDRKLYFIYAKEKDWDNTLACALSVLSDPEIDSEEQLSYLKRAAQCYLNVNNADSAGVYYEKILAINPNDADTHKAMGMGYYNTVQRIIASTQAVYKNKQAQGKATSHDYSVMQTEAKRATLKYYPKAKEHLLIANKQLNDPNITGVLQRINNNLAAYQK